MSTETTADTKEATKVAAQQLPEHAEMESMPPVEPLQMSQIDMLKIAPTREERLFLLLSIFIGIISGPAGGDFRMAIDWLQVLLLGSAPGPQPVAAVLRSGCGMAW